MLDADSHIAFVDLVRRNSAVAGILDAWPTLDLPDCWLTAGCLFQTIWNLESDREPADQIKDYDLFYFDPADLSAERERSLQERLQLQLGYLGVIVEAKNQARVHLWYADHFGHPYPALRDSSDGIDRFLVRETCVGIRPALAGGYEIHAPFGLAGIAEGTLTPNPRTPFRALFDAKVASYRARWPWLVIAD
jgi:hypothetical protein